MDMPAKPATRDGGSVAVFTIVSKNYLHFARTLMASVATTNPHWERWVLLADRVDGHFDAAGEPFQVVEASQLSIPELRKVCFRYTIYELNTAVKPWFFQHLFERGYARVVFLDPDIFVYAPLSELEAAWQAGALAVVTPHLTGRIRDQHRPSERDMLLAGTYNLGFLALARHPQLGELLEYWCEKSLREFVVDTRTGLFTDQKWIDLVPGMFRDTHIFRHEGYNIAYWNLPHRKVSREGDRFLVNDVPLVFFHFSGLDPAAPGSFSKHQNRYRLADVGVVADLVRRYCAVVRGNGYERCRRWPYAYGYLADGTPIPDEVRRLYQACGAFQDFAGEDPFALESSALNAPCDRGTPPLSWVMRAVHSVRADLQATFPDPLGRDREAFVRWFAENAELEHRLPAVFTNPFKRRNRAARRSSPAPASFARRPTSPMIPRFSASLRWDFIYGAARKAAIALREGRLPWSPRRWALLLRLHALELAQQRLGHSAGPLPIPARDPDSDRRPLGLIDSAHLRTPDVASDRAATAVGVTVVGYFEDQTGVAQAAHAGAAACEAVGLAIRRIDARPTKPPVATEPVNLLYVNADQVPVVSALLGQAFFRDRYTIAVWHWELEELPEEYLSSFQHLDEVWAPSQFVMRSIAAKSPIPVVHMPNAVTVPVAPTPSRSSLGLPEDKFLFLVMYDMLSVQERKNPLGAIEAFSRAFPDPQHVRLVVKINHGSSCPTDLTRVREHSAGIPGIMLLDRTLSRRQVYDLQAVCDAYVSLHRSEGWGLNLCESMLIGKPVIATNWSGNVDYMDHRNSCPVDYTLVPLRADFGPYRKGNRWADPDLDQAAYYMKSLVADPTRCRAIGERAKQTISSEYSALAVGRRYERRLRLIDRLR
jgi:glycosyltransferase involved in cell wall biosynthesis